MKDNNANKRVSFKEMIKSKKLDSFIEEEKA
jgi:hypothetical protein